MLLVLAFLLIIPPSLPPSLRPTYLYFVIALGAEAALLSASSIPLKSYLLILFCRKETVPDDKREAFSTTCQTAVLEHNQNKPNVVEKYASDEKIIGLGVTKSENTGQKCASMASLFFIGGKEAEAGLMNNIEERENPEDGGISWQGLLAKAENLIGNFYKQLKMQREESRKKLSEFYQKNLVLYCIQQLHLSKVLNNVI